MTVSVPGVEAARSNSRIVASIKGTLKFVVGVFLCLTPVTAVIVLGWLTRKTATDVRARRNGNTPRQWPNWIFSDDAARTGFLTRWTGGLVANLQSGATAWASVLALTLPFSLVWLAGWTAGWENSFNKGYEQSHVWPAASFAAVFLSVPVLVMLPMAIAHQAVTGRIASIIEFRKIFSLIRASGWRYLALSLFIGLGFVGVLGARGMPVFAEQMSEQVASGSAEAIANYAGQFKLTMTAILFVGLLIMRNIMARTYAGAVLAQESGRQPGWIKSAIIFVVLSALWLGLVFLVHLGQFLNYFWWSWINQPMMMLPWLGILR